MKNQVTATAQEKGILKALTSDRVKTWLANGTSEERMKEYMADPRWQHVMSQKVFAFQKKYF